MLERSHCSRLFLATDMNYDEHLRLGALCVVVTLLASVVRRLDNAIQRINHYPVDSAVCFGNTYPLDSAFIRWIALSAFRTTGTCYLKLYTPGHFNDSPCQFSFTDNIADLK